MDPPEHPKPDKSDDTRESVQMQESRQEDNTNNNNSNNANNPSPTASGGNEASSPPVPETSLEGVVNIIKAANSSNSGSVHMPPPTAIDSGSGSAKASATGLNSGAVSMAPPTAIDSGSAKPSAASVPPPGIHSVSAIAASLPTDAPGTEKAETSAANNSKVTSTVMTEHPLVDNNSINAVVTAPSGIETGVQGHPTEDNTSAPEAANEKPYPTQLFKPLFNPIVPTVAAYRPSSPPGIQNLHSDTSSSPQQLPKNTSVPLNPVLPAASHQSPSPFRVQVTQTQHTPNSSTINIDHHTYDHEISLALSSDHNLPQLSYDDVIIHPTHPFGDKFWKIVLSHISLPHTNIQTFDLIEDVFPMVYQILSNMNLGLSQSQQHGVVLNRQTPDPVDIMHILPPNITSLANNKVYKYLPSSGGGGGGGGDDNDGYDDLSSDEEDEEKATPDDDTNIDLGVRESVKEHTKTVLDQNRKLESSLAVIRMFVDVLNKVASAMSEHHYLLASQCRTLAHVAQNVNRGRAEVDAKDLVSRIFNIPSPSGHPFSTDKHPWP